jgi:hypothetical protein
VHVSAYQLGPHQVVIVGRDGLGPNGTPMTSPRSSLLASRDIVRVIATSDALLRRIGQAELLFRDDGQPWSTSASRGLAERVGS